MLRSYWLPILAVVGLILAQQAAQAQRSHGSTTQAQRTPQTQAQPAISPAFQDSLNRIGTALEAANNKPESAEEKEHAAADIKVQQQMADAADVMIYIGSAEALITFAGVLLVLGTLIYTKRAAEAAEAAVTVTKDTGAAQLRPYIVYDSAKISTLTAPPTKSGITKSLELDISFRNCGLTPGVITATSGALYAPSGKEGWRGAGSSWRPVRVVIGPNQTEKIRYSGISADENDKFSWFTIGILICYESLTGPAFEEYVWLTFDGSGMRQDYHSQGFSLYRPSES